MNQSESFLKRHSLVGFDTNVLIAAIKKQSDHTASARGVFEVFARLKIEAVLSTVSVPEIMAKPLASGQLNIVASYEDRLFGGKFSFAEVTLSAAKRATSLRVRFGYKLIDALIVASLMEVGVTGFITADKAIKSTKELEVLALTAG